MHLAVASHKSGEVKKASYIINVQDLQKKYEDKQAVAGVSFEVQRGEIFGLLGPNGAGKTTTMEMIEGLRDIDQGSVTIAEVDVVKDKKKLRRLIGVQLQSTSLFDLLSVEETLRLYASFYPQTQPVEHILEQMNLTEKRTSLVKGLSGGQKQRLAIGLAIIHEPEVIFLDEPTTGLDPQARRSLWDIILKIKEAGKTVVLSTHYMEEAHILCDRLAIMDNGKIIALDTPEKLIEELDVESAIQFTYTDPIPRDIIQGVNKIQQQKDQTVLYTKSLQDTLISLIKWADDEKIVLENIQTRKATLEDVFLELTGRSLRE